MSGRPSADPSRAATPLAPRAPQWHPSRRAARRWLRPALPGGLAVALVAAAIPTGTTAAASPDSQAPAAPLAEAARRAPGVGAAQPVSALAAPLRVRVDAISPVIATPGKPVDLRIAVTNTAATPTTGPVQITLRLGTASSILTRTQVRAFSAKPTTNGRLVARTTTPTYLPATTTAAVNVTIPGSAITSTRPFGVLPVTLQAQAVPAPEAPATSAPPGTSATPATPGTPVPGPASPSSRPSASGSSGSSGTSSVPGAPLAATHATFLPFHTRKEYQPLDVAVVAPLTLDPRPELVNATGEARAQAWTKGAGPGSRIDRILDATQDEAVTWAVDPALLGPAPDGVGAGDDQTVGGTSGETANESSNGGTENGGTGNDPTPSTAAGSPAAAERTATSPEPSTGAPSGESSVGSNGPAADTSTDGSTGGSAAAATPPTSPGASPSPAAPAPTPAAPTPTSAPTPTAPPVAVVDPAAPIQEALRRRLAMLAGTHPVWSLPRQDPDLSALVAAGASRGVLTRYLGGESGLAQTLDVAGVARVSWPIGTPLTRSALAQVESAFGAGGPTAHLVPARSLDTDPDTTGGAVRRTASGRLVLAYDDELSRLLSSATTAQGAGDLAARTLAETVALLGESPGRRRTVLLAADRGFDPDPRALSQVLGALRAAPWITRVGTGQFLDPQAASSTVELAETPRGNDPAGESTPPSSPLTTGALERTESGYADVRGLASVLSATPTSAIVPDPGTLDSLVSARWRGHTSAWQELFGDVTQRLRTLTTGVTVVPSTINFFAEHGIMQVTVVNQLDVEVHDVHLVLDPQGRPSRLRVTKEPAPLTIRPGSRTTVRVQVEAIAAGVVPVSAYLATPENTRLGTDATVRVRVQPTNGWVMLALGGLAGVVFIAGLYRALRAGRPRVTSQALKEIDRE